MAGGLEAGVEFGGRAGGLEDGEGAGDRFEVGIGTKVGGGGAILPGR